MMVSQHVVVVLVAAACIIGMSNFVSGNPLPDVVKGVNLPVVGGGKDGDSGGSGGAGGVLPCGEVAGVQAGKTADGLPVVDGLAKKGGTVDSAAKTGPVLVANCTAKKGGSEMSTPAP